jgi:hypothetical protein
MPIVPAESANNVPSEFNTYFLKFAPIIISANPALKVTGVGNGGIASNASPYDINAVNGILNIIDRVLLPQ